MSSPPQALRLSKNGETLTIVYTERSYAMSAEYLRVCSPSAEVRGHGRKWEAVGGKKQVRICEILPVGHYAVRLVFSDAHQSGIYSWAVLRDLVLHCSTYWQHYLRALEEKGQTRERT